MKRILAVVISVLLFVGLLAGCGSSSTDSTKTDTTPTDSPQTSDTSTGAYKDGTYEAKGAADQYGNYSTVKVTVAGGKITDVEWKELTKENKEKDDTYGNGAGDENYKKAQAALTGSRTYGDKLKETQDIEKVDAVSGATQSNDTFKLVVKDALKDAKK